ncbi:MAG TPA: hypothetical protein VM260_19180 [Pirellula sp.]|nr:hypothetical protein [Pirellula sp.]
MNLYRNRLPVKLPMYSLLVFLIAMTTLVIGQEKPVSGWPPEVRSIKYLNPVDHTMQPSLFYDPGGDLPKPLLIALHSWSGD